ncbi:ketopantoate reductase family protein [Planctobacterium marinum]|uniref:2-dehydropantoate 2-reductase n=1 Tax=Planctobacterium marinum TaxID=1631968 RepID=A0AA48HII4_9ALTE|nr:2-dehydropantoate 2-reductase [Planctobacterium marinum]
MNVAVLGRGAIGSLLVAQSQLNQTPFDMWWRTPEPEDIRVWLQNGDTVSLKHSEKVSPDLLILPLKAWQISKALNDIKPYLSPQTCIALLHNGLGTEENTLEAFPENSILRLTTSKAARKNGDDVYETGYGQSHAGWLREPPTAQRIAVERLIAQVLAPCDWHRDISQPLWQKLAVNSVINPLTAIHQVNNGQLADKSFRTHIDELLREFCRISALENRHFDFEDLQATVAKVIALTAENFSSMHQDIYHHRPTEIDYINGYLLNRAKLHGITLPLNQSLYSQIKQLESNYLSSSKSPQNSARKN